jgi:hypothetical protein
MKRFDPNKSFLELPIVINTAVFLFAVSVSIASIILVNLPNKTLLLTYEGFNNLLVILRTPLSITALLIPIIAIFATNHRSAQTKKQMELTNNQIKIATDNNLFTNRFKHAEEFEKYLVGRSSSATINFTMPRLLHGKLYPNVIRGDFTMDSAPIKDLEADLETLIKSAEFDPQNGNFIHQITKFEHAVDEYCRKHDLSLHEWNKTIVDGVRQNPKSTKEYFVPLKSIATIVVAAASFDGDECLDEKTKTLFSLNLAAVMDSKLGNLLIISLSNILEDL